mgnify:CR=1 FL=1
MARVECAARLVVDGDYVSAMPVSAGETRGADGEGPERIRLVGLRADGDLPRFATVRGAWRPRVIQVDAGEAASFEDVQWCPPAFPRQEGVETAISLEEVATVLDDHERVWDLLATICGPGPTGSLALHVLRTQPHPEMDAWLATLPPGHVMVQDWLRPVDP